VERILVLESDLGDLRRRFSEPHGDWYGLDVVADGLEAEAVRVNGELRGELERAEQCVRALHAAAERVRAAAGLLGAAGSDSLERARAVLANGEYVLAHSHAEDAMREADQAIREEEERERRRRREAEERREAERRGISATPDIPDTKWINPRTGDQRIVPVGIDPGWERNPGKLRRDAMEALLAGKLDALPEELAQTALRDIATSWRAARVMAGDAPGTVPLARLARAVDDTRAVSIGATPGVAVEDLPELATALTSGRIALASGTLIAFDPASGWIVTAARRAAALTVTAAERGEEARWLAVIAEFGAEPIE
jgi:hypothetical protein